MLCSRLVYEDHALFQAHDTLGYSLELRGKRTRYRILSPLPHSGKTFGSPPSRGSSGYQVCRLR